jgi:hypothetical protein
MELLWILFSAVAQAGFSAQAEKVAHSTSFPVGASETVSISFVKLGNDPWQLGMLQKIRVNAPLERLTAALDDVPGYVGIFDDLEKSEKRSVVSPDDYVVFTETSIPLPFVPNDKTSMRYRIEHLPRAVGYRFALTEGNHLRSYDGYALASADGPRSSVYWELDFIEPAFGISRGLPVKKFWVQNAEGSAQSDWALKLKAEGFGDSQSILAESKKRASELEESLGAAYEAATPFEALLAQTIPTSPSANASAKKPTAPPHSTAKPKANGPKSDPSP